MSNKNNISSKERTKLKVRLDGRLRWEGLTGSKRIPSEEQYKIVDEIIIEEPILTIFSNKQTTNFKECVICLEEMVEDQELILIRCSHIYHKECLEKWIYKNSICPLCDFKI